MPICIWTTIDLSNNTTSTTTTTAATNPSTSSSNPSTISLFLPSSEEVPHNHNPNTNTNSLLLADYKFKFHTPFFNKYPKCKACERKCNCMQQYGLKWMDMLFCYNTLQDAWTGAGHCGDEYCTHCIPITMLYHSLTTDMHARPNYEGESKFSCSINELRDMTMVNDHRYHRAHRDFVSTPMWGNPLGSHTTHMLDISNHIQHHLRSKFMESKGSYDED